MEQRKQPGHQVFPIAVMKGPLNIGRIAEDVFVLLRHACTDTKSHGVKVIRTKIYSVSVILYNNSNAFFLFQANTHSSCYGLVIDKNV